MSEQKKSKKSGPRLPKGLAKSNIVPVRLNDEDLKLFKKASRASNLTLSEWMRSTLRGVASSKAS